MSFSKKLDLLFYGDGLFLNRNFSNEKTSWKKFGPKFLKRYFFLISFTKKGDLSGDFAENWLDMDLLWLEREKEIRLNIRKDFRKLHDFEESSHEIAHSKQSSHL